MDVSPSRHPKKDGSSSYRIIGEIVHILVVEDEPKIADFVRRGLMENGFVVDVAENGEQGLEYALARKMDLIILDVVLPQRDG